MVTAILAGEWPVYPDNRVRIVLRTQDEKEITDANRFMTHMEIDNHTGNPYMASGHYDLTLTEAHANFLHRHTAL